MKKLPLSVPKNYIKPFKSIGHNNILPVITPNLFVKHVQDTSEFPKYIAVHEDGFAYSIKVIPQIMVDYLEKYPGAYLPKLNNV